MIQFSHSPFLKSGLARKITLDSDTGYSYIAMLYLTDLVSNVLI